MQQASRRPLQRSRYTYKKIILAPGTRDANEDNLLEVGQRFCKSIFHPLQIVRLV